MKSLVIPTMESWLAMVKRSESNFLVKVNPLTQLIANLGRYRVAVAAMVASSFLGACAGSENTNRACLFNCDTMTVRDNTASVTITKNKNLNRKGKNDG